MFIGVPTSLSGIATSVTAAAGGSPELAVSNTIGGIAVQAAFLAVTDRSPLILVLSLGGAVALFRGG